MKERSICVYESIKAQTRIITENPSTTGSRRNEPGLSISGDPNMHPRHLKARIGSVDRLLDSGKRKVLLRDGRECSLGLTAFEHLGSAIPWVRIGWKPGGLIKPTHEYRSKGWSGDEGGSRSRSGEREERNRGR